MIASPKSTRVPERSAWLEEDHAEVMTTALTMEGMAFRPAADATKTNGLVAAFPL